MNLSLYKATELASIEAHVDLETGEIDLVGFEQSQIALAEKQRAVVAYIKNQALMIASLRQVEADIASKRQAMIKLEAGLKSYLLENMKISGTSEIAATDGTFKAKLYLARDEIVLIEDGATFPPELCNEPKPPEPSKSKIKAAIEASEPVSGAYIIKKDRLEIK